ncbi:MAG: transcription termination factor NusA [Coriobacteriales bacterium]|nr:transcription termination factor NusA [Coriobacteriales bacterium]
MSTELIDALTMLAKEKDVDETILLDRLEKDLAKSYKSVLRLDWDCFVIIDKDDGQIYVFEKVGKGEYDEETGEYEYYEERDVTPEDVSRIAAQNAKRVINDIVKEAASVNIYKRYNDRVGDLVTGTVLQTTNDFTILKLEEGVEAELPHFDTKKAINARERNEKPITEHYKHNDRLKALIIDVREPATLGDTSVTRRDANRPPIVVSRTHPDLILRLLELEVPEIYDGIVTVNSIAREPGRRSKIAVSSSDSNLDPVGACVGPKGSRIRMIVGELFGERIDIVQYSENPVIYVTNALSPAKVSHVIIDEENHFATAIVEDDQLSLAIGKEGQNARLAAHLTGWHIDIKSVSLVEANGGIPENSISLIEEEDEIEEITDTRCAYVSEDGIRCRNQARENSHFCGIHKDEIWPPVNDIKPLEAFGEVNEDAENDIDSVDADPSSVDVQNKLESSNGEDVKE